MKRPAESEVANETEKKARTLIPGKDFTGVGVGAFVFDESGRVLLVKRSADSRVEPSTWARPGGAVEFGETCEAALERELFEETGLRICSPEVLDVTSKLKDAKHWVAIGYTAKLVAGCLPSDAENREPSKHDDLDWFSLDQLPQPIAAFTIDGIAKLRQQRESSAPQKESSVPGGTQKVLQVLETSKQRAEFTAGLRGKRVLHVKGFGSSFKEPTEEQRGLEMQYKEDAFSAMQKFAPDFLVVDGDPWGRGFQIYMKDYIDRQKKSGGQVPTLIWAKDVKLVDDLGSADQDQKQKKEKKAQEWVDNGFHTVVYWLDQDMLNQKINALFGSRFVEDHQSAKYNARGLLKILPSAELAWASGMSPVMRESISDIESVDRGGKQYFEKCSFENAAKGNLIFELMHNGAPAKHGAVCFGGGESILLELSTKYLHTSSGVPVEDVAVFPFSRGRDSEDPKLPRHVGASFKV